MAQSSLFAALPAGETDPDGIHDGRMEVRLASLVEHLQLADVAGQLAGLALNDRVWAESFSGVDQARAVLDALAAQRVEPAQSLVVQENAGRHGPR